MRTEGLLEWRCVMEEKVIILGNIKQRKHVYF